MREPAEAEVEAEAERVMVAEGYVGERRGRMVARYQEQARERLRNENKDMGEVVADLPREDADSEDETPLDWEPFEYNDIDSGRWDDDPSPYGGTYSEE